MNNAKSKLSGTSTGYKVVTLIILFVLAILFLFPLY